MISIIIGIGIIIGIIIGTSIASNIGIIIDMDWCSCLRGLLEDEGPTPTRHPSTIQRSEGTESKESKENAKVRSTLMMDSGGMMMMALPGFGERTAEPLSAGDAKTPSESIRHKTGMNKHKDEF
jgi:hypothetical protein